uniref:Uncharacterized protein n=1 Tax=Knipowitschia caucasica TaxID=637954 RepID=A0AAV2LVZ5_KNICA
MSGQSERWKISILRSMDVKQSPEILPATVGVLNIRNADSVLRGTKTEGRGGAACRVKKALPDGQPSFPAGHKPQVGECRADGRGPPSLILTSSTPWTPRTSRQRPWNINLLRVKTKRVSLQPQNMSHRLPTTGPGPATGGPSTFLEPAANIPREVPSLGHLGRKVVHPCKRQHCRHLRCLCGATPEESVRHSRTLRPEGRGQAGGRSRPATAWADPSEGASFTTGSI